MKRILQGFLGTIAVFALALAATLIYFWPAHTPDEEFYKLNLGMTRDEVLQVLGEPYSRTQLSSSPIWSRPEREQWLYTRGFYDPFLVKFGADGRVIERY